MRLKKEEIEHLGKLARLLLTDKEKEQYAKELSAILEYVEQLQEVDTENVPETNQVTGLEDVYRKDQVQGCSEKIRQGIIENFPEREGDLLKVPGVFE